MRKLSKKISMLMVLAMLVSLFSGVVSASAASSWSFYNKTADVVVERNGNYEMETNEFADFDLFKDGKTIDTDTYTVKYESSDASVVFVDAKNGKVRAKGEAGEKATFTAVITNKNTKVVARRSFNITIADAAEYTIVADFADEVFAVGEKYALAATVTADGKKVDATVAFTLDGAAITEFAPAEAGEYTIVATATVDGEVVTEKFVVVAEVVKAAFVKAVQKSLNTVVLTLANAADAEKLVANNALLTAEYYINDLTVPTPIKSIAAVKDDAKSVEVVLYNNLIKDIENKFFYDNATISVFGTSSDPDYIVVVGAVYEYQTEKDLVVKVFNAQDVDITADIDTNRISWEADTTEDYYVAGGKIFFYNENKTAKVTATLDMLLNEEYEENEDLKAVGYYTSVKTADVRFAPHGYQVVGTDVDAAPNSNYKTDAIKLAVEDNSMNVAIVYKYKVSVNDPADRYIYKGEDSVDTEVEYTYYSSNKSVVMVDKENGTLTAVAPGSTTVYVKAKKNNTESTICTIPVTVFAKRNLSSFNVKIEGSNKLSAQETTAVKDLTYNFTAKDQLGDDYKLDANLDFEYEITYPDKIKTNGLGNYLTSDEDLDTGKITIGQGTGLQTYLESLDKEYATIKFKVTAVDAANNNKKISSSEFTVLARNVVGKETKTVELAFSQTSVDMKLNKDNLGSYVSTLALAKKDSQGFYLGDQKFELIEKVSEVVTANVYYVLLEKDGKQLATDMIKVVANDADNTTAVAYNTVYDVDGNSDGTEVKKLDKGVYTAKLYVYNTKSEQPQLLATKLMNLSDSTEAYTVKVVKDKIDFTTLDGIKDAIEFYRGGNKIDNAKINTLVEANVESDDDHVYVTSVTVQITSDEMNYKFAGYYTVQEFKVNTLFDIKD